MKRFTMKRITALALALIMTLSLCPVTAFAEEQVYTDDQVYIAAEETEGIPEEDLMPTEEPIPSEVESTPAEEESTLVEETLSTEEPEDSEEEETVVMTETITVSSPAAYAASTVEARWGMATGTNKDEAPTSWAGSGTLAKAITYANGRTSGTAYIQLRSDVIVESTMDIAENKKTVFDLNGFTLAPADSVTLTSNAVIMVKGELILCDTSSSSLGKIVGRSYGKSVGVYVAGGSFTMNSGTICNHTSSYGGGVFVCGTFTMNGGTISGNSATDGGGVYTTDSAGGAVPIGIFTMNGGTISGNSSHTGGGVCSNGSFRMYGGTISGNTSSYGGGVWVDRLGSASVYGGTITRNNAYDSYGGVGFKGSFYVSGAPVINGNVQGGVASNVGCGRLFLGENKAINVGTLSEGATIGITPGTTPTYDTTVIVATSVSESDLSKFVSDNAAYELAYDGSGNLVIFDPSQIPITFDPNGGSGTMDVQLVEKDVSTALNANAFTNSGYIFAGWNTATDGTGIAYADKAHVTVASTSLTLYAQWEYAEVRWGLAVNGNAPADNAWVDYGTLSEAMSYYRGVSSSSSNTAYIQLLNDVNTNAMGALKFTGYAPAILDLNGYTIDRGLTAEQYDGYVICIGDPSYDYLDSELTICDTSASGDGTITGGYCTTEGGGIRVCINGTLTLNGGNITGNKARDGGGVYSYGAMTMNGGAVTNNTATSYNGGGVYAYCNNGTGSFTMTGGTISGNTARNGGGLYKNGHDFAMTGGTISDNTAREYGGGVYYYGSGGGVFTMSNSTISRNTAENGGGVHIEYGTFKMVSGSISKNTATVGGGGINLLPDIRSYIPVFVMRDGTISENSAAFGGGVCTCTFTMENGTISENKATSYGGGVFNCGDNFTMNGGTISDNEATEYGGGVAMDCDTFTLNAGVISGNTAQYGGGVYLGVFSSPGIFDVKGGSITGNSATRYGGGVYCGSDSWPIKVSGAPNISRNTVGTAANNLYLWSGEVIEVGTLANGAKIGVSIYEPSTFTSGGAEYAEDDYFTSDNSLYKVAADGENLKLEQNLTGEACWGVAVGTNAPSSWVGCGTLEQAVAYADGLTSGKAYIQLLDDANPSAPIEFARDKTAILDLNGYDIDRKLTGPIENGNVITVNGNLILCDTSATADGKITGGYNTGWGGGVVVNGTLTMNGGSVSGNRANYGGGISLGASNSTFIMTSGSVSGNTATRGGGGVYVYSGSVELSNGSISGNAASDGGGVYVTYNNWNDLIITGGTISGNTVTGNGGGLWLDHYSLVEISGSPVIFGNTNNGAASNVYLSSSTTFTVKTISSGANIGLAMQSGAGVFAEPDGTEVTTLSGSQSYFTSDDPAYKVEVDGNNLKMQMNEALWGVTSDSAAPATWIGGGTLAEAMNYANGLTSGVAYIQLLSDVKTSTNLVFDSGKSAVLDLNGHTIDRNLTAEASDGSVITVNGALILCDTSESGNGKITGGYANFGGGVYIGNSGSFTLNSGTISGNDARYGGGVYTRGSFTMNDGVISGNSASSFGGGVSVSGSGTFTMKDGTISGNNATYNTNITPDQFGGGGVAVVGGTFTLDGGTISGNTANYGGGVFVRDNGAFTMEKGTITGNINSKHGAGVYVYIGDFVMRGGSISGNTASVRGGGVRIESNLLATMTVSGASVISGNTVGANKSNVYLASGKTITVGELSSGANIGVAMVGDTGTFAIGGAEYSGFFTSDNAAYAVAADGENLKLYDPTQITITFDANGGEGTMAAQTVTSGVAAMLNANTFTRTNYSFAGWNTKADGTGSAYVDRCSVTVTKAVTLYAQWKLNEARWGYACVDTTTSGSHFCLANGVGTGTLNEAISFANGLNPYNTIKPEKAYIQLLTDVDTSSPLEFASDTITVLDLNGHTIDRGLTKATENGNVITVNGNLILLDSSESASGKITGGYNSTSAGGVHVAAGGNFVMNSGSITGNTSANHGGGVWCQGNFTMNGGTISANVADNGKGDTGAGGGVSCSGTFTMNNGVISGNRSLYHGGGVYVNTSCVFIMNGGEISNNTGRYCGGAYVYGTATIAGGKITGNTASDYGGGVYAPSGTLTISGNPEISGNVSASVAQNVYVYKRNPVIIDMLSVGAKIGVTLDSNAGIFTSGGAEYANSGYFFSDDAAYDVVTDGANLKLATPITGSVSVSGTTEYGKTLSATYSNEAETVAYQWYRNGVAITDATENVYTLDRDDVGKSISVVVTGVGNYTGTKEAAIEGIVRKAIPSLGVVAVNGVVTDTTAPAEVVLTKTAGPDGTLVITDSAMLANQSEYHWTFTPTESNCYNAVSGTVQIDVLDTVPPTVSIKVTDTDTEWKQLLNDISFGLFFKNTQQVTITYADDETGSGLKETLYYRSNEAIADFTDVQWSTYEGAFNIDPDGEFVIYAKATDNDGNSIIVNSDGIVLDATAPILQGITDGETYYGDTAFVVEESYLDTLKVDGIDVTAQISENGEYTIVADNAQHTITVTDKAGNETTYTVTIMKNYTVTFMADGIVVDTQTVGHGQNIPADNIPDVPYKDGCDQSEPYWSYNGAEFEPDMPITEDVVITAVYSINKHTVTFKVEDIVVDTVEVEHGSLVTPPSVPTEEGYSFYGWFTEAECINEWNTEADVVTEDLVLYAVGGLWCEAISDYAYIGTALKPEINVYFGMIPLVLNKDYTISYKNNTNVYAPVDTAEELAEFETKLAELDDPKAKTVTMNDGTVVTIAKVPQIVIKGKGNFAGTVTKYFVIEPINLNDDLVSVSDMTALYSGKVQNPKVTVSYGTKKLGTKDFTISYPDTDTTNGIPYFAAGTWTIQLDGTGNYTGTRYVNFVITKAQLMSKATIGKIAAYEYTGEEIKPAVTVTVSKATLVENADYTVDYLNNVEVGTATVVITGMGNYAGTKTATFKITGASISKVQANGIPKSMMYTGSDIELTGYSLFDQAKGVMLEEGTHYTVDYSNNTNKGTATILFTGIGKYTGTLKKTFKIDAYDILKDVDECIGVESSIVVPFMKGGAKPDPEITFNGETLVAGVDYTLAYKNNTAVAVGDPGNTKAPTITITGKGNFSGKLTLNFSIEAKSISETTLTVDDKPYAAKATGLPTVTLTDTDGKKLAAGKDYDKAISYTYTTDVTLGDGTKRSAGDAVDKKDIIPVNTVICVTVTGIGAYTGEATATYRIVPQSLAKATVKVANQQYTGKPIIPDKSDITVTVNKVNIDPDNFEIVSCTNNVNKGSATLTIHGVSKEYGGIKTVTFKIDAKTMFWYEVRSTLFGLFS